MDEENSPLGRLQRKQGSEVIKSEQQDSGTSKTPGVFSNETSLWGGNESERHLER